MRLSFFEITFDLLFHKGDSKADPLDCVAGPGTNQEVMTTVSLSQKDVTLCCPTHRTLRVAFDRHHVERTPQALPKQDFVHEWLVEVQEDFDGFYSL